MTIYVVQRGDTLPYIASLYNISVESIIAANGLLNPNQLVTGQALVIPIEEPGTVKPAIDVNAYIYTLGKQAVPIINEVGVYLSQLTPFSYQITDSGGLIPIDDQPSINAALKNRALPMMCITNFTLGEVRGRLTHTVLSDPDIISTLLTNIVNTMRNKGYAGLNIDFEYVLPEDRLLYNQFLQKTVDVLHREGYFVSTAVAPKTGPEQKGLLYEAIDYLAQGQIVDFVILMTYEWGYRLAAPQPISPLNEIRRVLDYAVQVIPRNKIYFGFQIYARAWVLPHVQGQAAETFSCQEALLRAARYGAVILYDTVAEAPYYRYVDGQGISHEVWFEDARSAQAKFDTVKAYGLKGISYWVLGYPFPENWTLLGGNFLINKYLWP